MRDFAVHLIRPHAENAPMPQIVIAPAPSNAPRASLPATTRDTAMAGGTASGKAAGAVSGTGTGGSGRGMAACIDPAYLEQIMRHVGRWYFYPDLARRQGASGVAYVQFVIDKGGHYRQLTLAQNRLRALERRQQALSFKATCNCTVIWTAPAQASVAPGALLMSMVSADEADVRVEALLPADAAASVHPGQVASVTPAGSAGALGAHVESLRYENSNAPRVGLGDRGSRITVVLKLDGPIDGLTPGTPANVVIRK